MTDYLIRTEASQDWPAVHRERLSEVLIPLGFDCQVVDGWGDLRLRCGESVVSFSGEEPGWLVTVEGDLRDTEGFLAQVTAQVTEAVGERCEWLAVG